jgi:DNA-binding transcriptional LysR family regulator
MKAPRITLEQWRTLIAVVEAGGYAAAAERLSKSQSTVTYAIQKMESLLDIKLFETQGRKAVLTDSGKVLVRRGKVLLNESERLEQLAATLSRVQESELRLAVEIIFPTWLLLQELERFGAEFPDVRVELFESVLGGTEELLHEGRVDLAIGSRLPPGFSGDPLLQVRFVCCAAPSHPLNRSGRALVLDDLRHHRHLIVRDSGSRRSRSVLALDSEQRLTVSAKATSIRAACMGLGFAWFAESSIRSELESGELVPLPLAEGGTRQATLYLLFADPDGVGPATRNFAEGLRRRLASLPARTPELQSI